MLIATPNFAKGQGMTVTESYTVPFSELRISDIYRVGGKNASLGEMIGELASSGIRVPQGFATTAQAYWDFISTDNLKDKIAHHLEQYRNKQQELSLTGSAIRELILQAKFPTPIADAITKAYRELGAQLKQQNLSVAVRSSATAEDLPDVSFAGQQESFLNITGEQELLNACRYCFASLFTDRAIAYRELHGFDHMKVALSAGIQQMVRSDKACAGVMFTIDTETGFPNVVLITGAWGLGESVVKGQVQPDEYIVFKPLLQHSQYTPIIEKSLGQKSQKIIYGDVDRATTQTVETSDKERSSHVLSDAEILQLARWGCVIQAHYATPMDIEWAKDGITDEIFIVQARPETVQSRRSAGALKLYKLVERGRQLISGVAVGEAIATGRVYKLKSAAQANIFPDGAILVAETTDPDWVPIMRRASAIITDHGGRTSHAAIVSRELNLPAVIGTIDATHVLQNGQDVTVSCAEGDKGFIYEGILKYEVEDLVGSVPQTRTQVMLNLANPASALHWWRLPNDGVGLARIEFIISNLIKIHPMALVHYDKLTDDAARAQIAELTQGFTDKTEYFVQKLAYGIARIAASQYPKPVIVRMSDFKTNEYAALIGGAQFEPSEENPMLGWRGASRYYDADYREGFALECRAIRKAREEIGLSNVIMMIPFCRTLEEADKVLATLSEQGLSRGKDGLQIYVMCEIPSNVILGEQFADRFDGFSIGSNDLTQLTLGIDRDSERLAPLFSEQNEAVITMIKSIIRSAHRKQRKVGLCGQAPSDHPEFACLLVNAGIDSISVSPDSFIAVKKHVAAAEAERAQLANRLSLENDIRA